MYIKSVKISSIESNEYQVRFKTGTMDIETLVKSIKTNGLISPPIVFPKNKKYVIVFGHRRLEAVKKLKWDKIPVIVLDKKLNDRDTVIKSLIENIERVDLTPFEKAKAYEEMIEKLNITQDELARRINCTRSEIAHYLRLLKKLNPYILEFLHQGKISFGHAKVLMELTDKNKQLEICKKVIDEALSVANTAVIVDQARPEAELTERQKELNKIERNIMKTFKTEWLKKVYIRQGEKEEKLVIEFSSRQELKNLLSKLLKAV